MPEEVPVEVKNLPGRIQAPISRQAGKGTIREIEKITVSGKTVYEAEILRNGREIDILVGPKGKFLGTQQQTDPEAQDKDEKTEDE